MKQHLLLVAFAVGVLGAQPALAEIVVVVNPANQASRMFSEQAAQFFLGKSNQFTPGTRTSALMACIFR